MPVTRNSLLQHTQPWALERLGEPLTAEALARHADTSVRRFTRHFARAAGTTPLAYRQVFRGMGGHA